MSRHRRARIPALILAIVTMLGTLASGWAFAAGTPCPGATECPEGEVCANFVCQPSAELPPPRVCSSDAQCRSREFCNDGICASLPLPECGDAIACPAGTTCVDGRCHRGSPVGCSATDPCPPGEACIDGECVTGGCDSEAPCPAGYLCEERRCVPRTYEPPSLSPLDLPDPPIKRTAADGPPVWDRPDGDDPFGDVPPEVPSKCGRGKGGNILCCTAGTGWSFERDQVDKNGKSVFKPWGRKGVAFGRGPVYGNNVHIDRIRPPGYTSSAEAGPAANVGGDYWAFSRDVNQQGMWWMGSSDVRTSPRTLPGGRANPADPEKATGSTYSPRFKIDTDYIRFYVGGHQLVTQRVQLEILEPNAAKRAELGKLYDGIGVSEFPGAAGALPIPALSKQYVVVRASAPLGAGPLSNVANEYMGRRVAWDVREFKGRTARIVVVDEGEYKSAPAPAGHINVDEFLCTDTLDDEPVWPVIAGTRATAKVGAAITPVPLWGTSDSHVHPFANLAFGGNLVWGDPHDDLDDVYACTGTLPEIREGSYVLRPEVQQRSAEACSASSLLVATVAAIPCGAWLGIPLVGIPLAATCQEAVWDVTDVLMNQSLIQVSSLHGSPSPLSGGVTVTGAREVLQEVTPFMNTFGDVFPDADLPDFGGVARSLPDHVAGLVERLAWDTDDGRHSQHGIKGHALYQKDMIRRAHQGGLRLIGLDVIDSRTISETLDREGTYDEWVTIWKTVMSTRHLVSCGDDPLFPSVGPLCDIAGIAYSPADVRRLVGAGKLAIVLGTETDELGIPRDPTTMALFQHAGSVDSVALQIDDLYALGIRKVTAIHALNNPLGGAGIFNDTYLAGTNELSNVVDPTSVEASSLTIPFFVAGNFTEDMFAIKHWETDPNDPSWTEWYQDHGGWVALDQQHGSDWIGGGVTFQYGYPSVATPLGFPARSGNFQNGNLLFPVPAFNAHGTWSGVNEVQHLKDVDQLISGGAMCKVDGVGLPLGADQAWVPADVRAEYDRPQGEGFANAVGLRDAGKAAIAELMKRGMIIDLDHFSQKARVDAWAVADDLGAAVFDDVERSYPFFGVHTNSRTHERHGPFPDFDYLRDDRGYTAETDRTVPEFLRSKRDGGVFSPGANAGYVTDAPDEQAPQVRNDCDYSAKSFALRYLWMVDVMDGRGLTPSTDMSPFFTPAAPRFGQYQCHLRTSYEDDMVGLETAPGEFERTCPFPAPPGISLQCKAHQWPHDWIPDAAGKETCKVNGYLQPGCPTYENLQAQYREGAGVWYEDYAGRESAVQPSPGVKYVTARRASEERDDAAPRAEVDEIVSIGGARQMWPMKKMKTTAAPKLNQTRNTGWDVNLDGFQHIGLFPDFLQDVRNVGVSWERMTPMFNAVEDYVRMWERACDLADTWHAKDGSVPGCQ